MTSLLGCTCHTKSTCFHIAKRLRETKNFDRRYLINTLDLIEKFAYYTYTLFCVCDCCDLGQVQQVLE